MAYDKAEWHYGGDFPDDLPSERGATHIGMFLAWAINTNLIGDIHRDHSQEALAAVRDRRQTGREFLLSMCDETLSDEDLNDTGNAFAERYYEEEGEGSYLDDYERELAANLPTLYHVEDSWENYDRIARTISARYGAWLEGNTDR